MPALESHPSSSDLSAFALGALDDAAHAAVEAHLAGCPACQERAARASADSLVALLQRAHAREEKGTLGASDFAALKPARGAATIRLRRQLLVALLAALVLAAVAFGVLVIRHLRAGKDAQGLANPGGNGACCNALHSECGSGWS